MSSYYKLFKGTKAEYDALHNWVKKSLGKPLICSQCKIVGLPARNYHWANDSGEYKYDLSDWVRLCVKCHFRKDQHIFWGRKKDKCYRGHPLIPGNLRVKRNHGRIDRQCLECCRIVSKKACKKYREKMKLARSLV